MVGCKWARMGAAICPPIVSVPKCSQISNCPRGVLCANSFFNMRTYLKTRPRNARSAKQRNSYQKWKIWKTGFSVRLELKNSGEILLIEIFYGFTLAPLLYCGSTRTWEQYNYSNVLIVPCTTIEIRNFPYVYIRQVRLPEIKVCVMYNQSCRLHELVNKDYKA